VQDDLDKQRWDDKDGALDQWQRRRLRKRCRPAPVPRLFFALLLIAAGTLLFLSNLGVLPELNIWAFWPAIFVIAGLAKLTSDSRRSGQAFGLFLIAAGSLITLINLGILHIRAHDDSWPLSLVLMAAGVIALIKVLERSERPRPNIGSSQFSIANADTLNEQIIFGSLKRKIESGNFQGGKLDSIFGSIDLNFRQAQISTPERSATLEVNAVFGSIELRVPETWRVVAQATGVFGSVEDKTIANKVPGFEGPTLFVTGFAVFGSVEIKD
jgi:predicted membrane protein